MTRKRKLILAGLAVPALLLAVTSVNGVLRFTSYIDFDGVAAPSNPAAGDLRVFANSGTGQLACLDSAGASCLPTGGGGGLTLVEQHTASASASLDFTTCISSTYDTYEVVITSLVAADNNTVVFLRFSTDGGMTFDSGNNYSFTTMGWAGSGVGQTAGSSQNHIRLQSGGDMLNTHANCGGTCPYNMTFRIYDPLSTALYKHVAGGQGTFWTGGPVFAGLAPAGFYQSTTAVDAFQIILSAGNIASGEARCYGLEK